MGVTDASFSPKEIARYYDVSEDHYIFFWDLKTSHALHYGYWDTNTRNFREALSNINALMADTAAIHEGTAVLDAGCGVGGSTMWLAKNRKAIVTGITLSAKQAARGNTSIQQLNLSGSAVLEVNDFTHTSYKAESFDVVWAIESVCHAADKKEFLHEAYRLLKPGGRLVMADFFIEQISSAKDQVEMDAWAHGWAVPFFEKAKSFESFLHETGFESVRMTDITPNIMKSARRLYRAFFPGWIVSKMYNFFNRHTTDASKQNVYTAWYQYRTLKKGLWKYYLVSAEKKK